MQNDNNAYYQYLILCEYNTDVRYICNDTGYT